MTLGQLGLSPWAVRALAFVWGCLWGSFVNVVVYRLPREMSVVRPGSHCPACGAGVRPLDNIPLVSWILLRGRARCCGERISARYPAVELMGGLIALAIVESLLRTLPPGTAVERASAIFLANFALAMALLAAAFIDAAHMYLPDVITIGGTIFGLATPGLRDLTWLDSLTGAAIGFVGVWLPLVVGYKALRGRQGMGLGDAKLLMLAGAWYGWAGAVFVLFGGALQATVVAGLLMLFHGKIEEPEAVRADREALHRAALAGDEDARNVLQGDPLANAPAEGFMAARLPFGPFLCLGSIEWMLAGEWIAERVTWLHR
jgi:leader peptidase (prepilin peptidase)/N-methyltransferase